MKERCDWPGNTDELMMKYHDEEWGVPLHDDHKLFEFLVLEGMQAGLSWRTVLHKREAFRVAFDNFMVEKVAAYSDQDVERLLQNPGIIRNRLKIQASIINAKQFIKVQEKYGSFDSYIWGFTDGKTVKNAWKKIAELPAKTELSDKISKDLLAKGFKFVGSTIVYAHMQATGMVNDHLTSCFRYNEV